MHGVILIHIMWEHVHKITYVHLNMDQDLYLCTLYYLDPDHTYRTYFLVPHVDQDNKCAHKILS